MQKSDAELLYWLRLAHAPYLKTKTIKILLAQFESARAICHTKATELRRFQLNEAQIHSIQHPDKNLLSATETWLRQHAEHRIITIVQPDYPTVLSEIDDAPPILYVAGQSHLLATPQIAMVGSRNPSRSGIDIATQFAYELAQSGVVITSGLAIGIDAASHRGALQAHGKTIAVLGNGLLHCYPKKNQVLAEQMIEQGCLVSEWPLTAPPKSEHFPQRNRIISGLSLGVLVIEAALQSGSLITARYAMEQNREIFALPGSIRNPTSVGCLALIQQGAKCVTSIQDVLDDIKSFLPNDFHSHNKKIVLNSSRFRTTSLDSDQRLVLACIDYEPTTIDQICERSKLSAPSVMATLLILELNGYIQLQSVGYIKVNNP